MSVFVRVALWGVIVVLAAACGSTVRGPAPGDERGGSRVEHAPSAPQACGDGVAPARSCEPTLERLCDAGIACGTRPTFPCRPGEACRVPFELRPDPGG